ncbi:MAG TPA: hypothetical protein VFQ45_14870 [Longimicrobium sp.]|nr:hypothetical protein [Longimicrobium sp.]
MSARRGCAAAAAALVLAGCGGSAAPRQVSVAAPAETLVGADGGEIGRAADLAVDARGIVYVLDDMLHRVLVVPGDGGAARPIGRRGGGPGEINGPMALAVDDGVVRVADMGNQRVHQFAPDGRLLRSDFVSERTLGARVALTPRGGMAWATLRRGETSLASLAPGTAAAPLALGTREGPVDRITDYRAVKGQIRRGEIPRELRDEVLPVPSDGGGAWLVLLAHPAVARYGPDGTERWRTRIDAPEVEAIRANFFARNRALRSPGAFYTLSYVADAVETRGWLWLLLDTGPDAAAVVMVLDPGGKVALRLDLPGAAGARQLAVDLPRRRLYLALASAELVSLPLPAEVRIPS